MPSIGRNEPCPCGSGKKYKNCHGPIDAEQATAQRKIKQAPDTLLPKLMDALDRFGLELPAALNRFWNGSYHVQDIKELDEHEDRGSERFLTWFAFDAQNEAGQTPVQRLTADPEGLALTDAETQVLSRWSRVRLQPYEVVAVRKGHGLQVRPLFGDELLELEDHKAAKRVELGEVLITHLVPAGDTQYVAGAAAQLTPDTIAQLHEFAAVHLQDMRRSQPDATYADLIQSRSHIFNHFVMALPREQQEAGKLDELVAMTRAALNVTAEQIGFGSAETERSVPAVASGAPAAADGSSDDVAEIDADNDANVGTGVGDTTQTFETGGLPHPKTSRAEASSVPQYQGQDD